MISVCIPTYEQSGYGVHYLRQLLDSILVQRDAEFEVVVSDNSRNDAIRKLCQEFAAPGTHSLAVRYVRNLNGSAFRITRITPSRTLRPIASRLCIKTTFLFIRWRCICASSRLSASRGWSRVTSAWTGRAGADAGTIPSGTRKCSRGKTRSACLRFSPFAGIISRSIRNCGRAWTASITGSYIANLARLSLCACRSSGCAIGKAAFPESRDHARSRNTAICDRSI